jgi:hypothetical protein
LKEEKAKSEEIYVDDTQDVYEENWGRNEYQEVNQVFHQV